MPLLIHLSCLTNSYGRFGPLAALDRLPETGIRLLELPIRTAGVPSFFMETPLLTDTSSRDEVEQVRRQLVRAGLQLSSCNITSGNPLEIGVLELTLRKLDVAAQLGVPLVVAGGGEIHSDADWPMLVDHLRRIGDAAARHGITYCCETHPGTCRNADGMLELMRRVDHPQVRLNFDTGNIFYYNDNPDMLEELRRVLPFVRHLHLKDTSGKFRDWCFPAFGRGGAVDFAAVRVILEGAGYDGPASLEIEGIQGEPELTLEQTQERIRESVAHLAACGYAVGTGTPAPAPSLRNSPDRPVVAPTVTVPSSSPDVAQTRLPYLTSPELCISGEIKAVPEDFVVEEIPAYEPTGDGEHLFLWIQKRDCSAEFLERQIARELRISRDEIGMAGMKDRQAVTRQWVSVPVSAEPRLPGLDNEYMQVLKAVRHGNKLKTGHLRGNRFEVVVRPPQGIPLSDWQTNSLPIARQLVAEIAAKGVPNYFGEQRFGHDGETLTLGMSLLRGEADIRKIPYERRKFLLRLALSAAQSDLFNSVLARRLAGGTIARVLAGDVMQVTASGGVFNAEDLDREQLRCDQGETVITGPLFGPKMKLPTGAPFELEQSVLAEAGLTMEPFRQNRKLTPGGRRPLMVRPGEMQATLAEQGLLLAFTLPSGAYATVVLREFLKPESDAPDQSE